MISKLKALLDEGIDVGLNKEDNVLYLGASHGVTAKIISKIVGSKGFVFCLEVSSIVMRDLLKVCEDNENMVPLLYDANKMEEYEDKIKKVDFIYQDLAQRNQVSIFKKNSETFLKEKGKFVLIIKAKSIDAVKDVKEVIENVKKEMGDVKVVDMGKTHKGHYAILGEK
jgi:fibrillarin-like pre-rRNA processing protein